MVREGLEDIRRAKSDKELNSSECKIIKNKEIVKE